MSVKDRLDGFVDELELRAFRFLSFAAARVWLDPGVVRRQLVGQHAVHAVLRPVSSRRVWLEDKRPAFAGLLK